MRLLLVEDERGLNDIIARCLRDHHYAVDCCFDGQEALDYLSCAEYDAVILDILMPKLDGLQTLHSMRERGISTPVLLLTSKDTVQDRVHGLDAGADDYLVKPFSFDELLARIRVMLRHTTGITDNIFKIDDLVIDFKQRKVYRANKEIKLTGRQFDVLEYLARNSKIVLTRDKISQHLWNYDYDGSSNVIDVFIRYLRRKIDDDFDNKLIHTVRGVGYVLRNENEVG